MDRKGRLDWVVPIDAGNWGAPGSTQDALKQVATFLCSEEGDRSMPWDCSLAPNSRQCAQASSELLTLTLDFGSVGHISSEGLNELILIKRQARLRGVRLVLANVQEPLRQVFALTRLERMFEMVES